MITFLRFCLEVLRVALTPAQRVLCMVAFDGVDPCDLIGEDRELARQLFGDVDTVPPSARRVLAAVCGARGGKTYVLGALYSLWRALVADLSTLAPGENAVALIVAPDMRLARQCLRYVIGAARLVPSIARLIESETSDALLIRRPDGCTVSIEVLPATRGGSALRGRTLVSAVLDEAAFFRDESSAVNDVEIFRAVTPRVKFAGAVIIVSTPWTEAGLLYDLFTANRGKPKTALAVHAPTLLLRGGDAELEAIIAVERERDPENARREYDAEFFSAGSGLFFDPRAIDQCVDESIVLPVPQIHEPGWIAVGCDFGFVHDESAVAVVQRARSSEQAIVSLVDWLAPTPGAPLQPSMVAFSFARMLTTRYPSLASITADAHYLESMREHFFPHGLRVDAAPAGQEGKALAHLAARELINERRVRLPRHARLLTQLKQIMSKPTPGGGLRIFTTRRAGAGHGDIASAAVLAMWSIKNTDQITHPMAARIAYQAKLERVTAAMAFHGYATLPAMPLSDVVINQPSAAPDVPLSFAARHALNRYR